MPNVTPILVTGAVTISPAGLPVYTGFVNLYGEILVPFNTETTIVSYTIPAGKTFYATGFRASGDTSGEFFLKINGVKVGYSRTTAADPTSSEDYVQAPASGSAGQIVTITTITYMTASHTMRATLLGGLV